MCEIGRIRVQGLLDLRQTRGRCRIFLQCRSGIQQSGDNYVQGGVGVGGKPAVGDQEIDVVPHRLRQRSSRIAVKRGSHGSFVRRNPNTFHALYQGGVGGPGLAPVECFVGRRTSGPVFAVGSFNVAARALKSAWSCILSDAPSLGSVRARARRHASPRMHPAGHGAAS